MPNNAAVSETTISEILINPPVKALKEKHIALSKQVEEAQKDLSTTSFYLNQLKKQKLVMKERIIDEASREAS